MFISGLIHYDQVGFIQTREARDNVIRKMINIIHSPKEKKGALTLLGIDTEKSFDGLNWTYMEEVLQILAWGQM